MNRLAVMNCFGDFFISFEQRNEHILIFQTTFL